ncbi:O-antigen ligase family protein [Neobacillus cucumis]|uniref:O-antigen ligase family protein n=1 Tax=Neobacillus cucumis TaxID=1740721 RepID=UPI00196672D8|nr:O-antigen ligase family protein [Neobacillus cucumis]MBM7652545.1 hypothetical protein [Neobacillus cucumis]
MYVLIVIAILFSALSGIAGKLSANSTDLSSLTILPVIGIFFAYLIRLLKEKGIINYKGIYWLVFLNILFIFVGMFTTNFNIFSVKFVIYYVFIIVLLNILDKDMLIKVCKVLMYVSILLSLDIIFQGVKLLGTGVDLVNLRSYTLMDKQYYTVLYAIVLPTSFWFYFTSKKLKDLVILIVSIIACILFMQIKTLLISIPLSIYLILFITNGYSRKKLFMYGIVLLLIFVYLIITGNEFINQFYVILYYIFGMSDKIPLDYLKYVDTLIIRLEIIRNAMSHFSHNVLFGIGYGNYADIAKGDTIKSIARNITYDLPAEAESGVLLLLVEGGIIGLLLHFSVYVYIFRGFIKNNNKDDLIQNIITSIVLVNGIANIFQDNLNLLYWFFLGAGIYVNSGKTIAIPQLKKSFNPHTKN